MSIFADILNASGLRSRIRELEADREALREENRHLREGLLLRADAPGAPARTREETDEEKAERLRRDLEEQVPKMLMANAYRAAHLARRAEQPRPLVTNAEPEDGTYGGPRRVE